MPTIHQSALKFGAFHFFGTLGLAFLIVAGAASGMSDSAQGGSSGEGALMIVAFIFQAPVAIVQWLAIRYSKDGQSGFDIQTLISFALPSSLLYGYLISFFVRKNHRDENRDA
jgi:hypothetical protein